MRDLTVILASFLVLACKSAGDTAAPDTADGGDTTPAEVGPAEGEPVSDVPPAVAELEAVPNAKQLGSKMWRRFGPGEWTANSFFVPDAKTRTVTVIVDMEGGGEAVSDPFELVVQPQGLTLVEGEATIDGRVPPGMKRRATWKFTAAGPGIAKIDFVTMKGGEKKGGTTACLNFADDVIYRCTEKEAGDTAPPDTTKRATYCCTKGKNQAGEGCEPITDEVDAMKACMKAKKFSLTCDSGAACTGKSCKCQ